RRSTTGLNAVATTMPKNRSRSTYRNATISTSAAMTSATSTVPNATCFIVMRCQIEVSADGEELPFAEVESLMVGFQRMTWPIVVIRRKQEICQHAKQTGNLDCCRICDIFNSVICHKRVRSLS